MFSREELEHIAGLCQKHDLIAVTDEVYEHLVFYGEHIPLATLPVEFNASFARALPILDRGGYLPKRDLPAARRILREAPVPEAVLRELEEA